MKPFPSKEPPAPPAKPCESLHHMPDYWRDERHDNTIKTYCKDCGKFIGQRPIATGKTK